MEERREPRIFHDVCHLASLWKWLRLNRLFPMHEAHGPRTGDGSGLTTLYRGTEVSNVAPLCQLPWHITTHDLLHFFFLFMDVYSTFFSPTSVRESLPFSLVLMDGPSTNSRKLPLDIVARLSLRFYAFERNGDYYFSQLGFIVSSMIEAWNQLININVSTKYNVKYSDELRINQEPTNLLFDASKKFLLLRSIFGR